MRCVRVQTGLLRTTLSLEHGSCGWYGGWKVLAARGWESSSVKCWILSKLTVGPCSAASGNSIATKHKESRLPSLKAHAAVLWNYSADPEDHYRVCPMLRIVR